MMTYALLLILCVVFFELFKLLRIGKDAIALVVRSQEAVRVLQSPTLGDDEKESLTRRASLDIFKATFRFALKFLLIALALYLLFLLSVALFPELKEPMQAALFSPAVIVALTFATLLYAWVRRTMGKH